MASSGERSIAREPAKAAYRPDTTPALALACALIVNSHLEEYWPKEFLAADGLLGNTLFFVMSGFGVGASLFSRHQRFLPFMTRRVARIYPAVILAVFCFRGVCDGRIVEAVTSGPALSASEIVRLVIWPGWLTYVRAIMPCYAIGFFLAVPKSVKVVETGVVLAIAAMFWYSLPAMTTGSRGEGGLTAVVGSHAVTNAYSLAMFLCGTVAAVKRWYPFRDPIVASVMSFGLLIAYLALKYLIVVQGRFTSAWLLLFVFAGFLSLAIPGIASNQSFIGWVNQMPSVSRVIRFVADHTLEIYVVHSALLSSFPQLAGVIFPLNILFLVGLSLLAAAVMKMATKPV